MKKLVLAIMILVLASSVYAALEDYNANLADCWDMNTDDNAADINADNDMTDVATPKHKASGGVGGSGYYDIATTAGFSVPNDDDDFEMDSGVFTVCLWVRNGTGTTQKMVMRGNSGGGGSRWSLDGQANVFNFEVDVDPNYEIVNSANKFGHTTWQAACGVRNATHFQLWINGSALYSETVTAGDVDDETVLGIGTPSNSLGSSEGFGGGIDQVCIWKGLALGRKEIEEYWNDGDGKAYPFSDAASAAVSFKTPTPANSTKNNTYASVYINASCGDLDGSDLVTIWFGDDTSRPKTDVVINATSPQIWKINATYAPSDDIYYYSAKCNSSTDIIHRKWTLDTTEPGITLDGANSGINTQNITADRYANTLYLKYSLSDNVDLFATEINISFKSNGTTQYNFSNQTLSGVSATITKTINTEVWDDGTYLVTLKASDSHTANIIDNYDIDETLTSLTFNTAEGNEIIINSFRNADWQTVKSVDRYSITFTPYTTDLFGKYKFQIYCDNGLKYRPNSGYEGHFVCMNSNFKGNWLDFETDDNTPIKVTDEGEGWFEIEVEFEGSEITFNSIGGLNTNEISYEYNKSTVTANSGRLSPTFPVVSTPVNTYCKATDGLSENVHYNYRIWRDKTIYVNGNLTNQSSGSEVFVYEIPTTALAVGQNWTVSCRASTDKATNYTGWTNSSKAIVVSYLLDNCSTANVSSYNVSFFKHDGTLVNVNFSSVINYYSGNDTTITYSYVANQRNNLEWCIYPNSINFTTNFIIEYGYTGSIFTYHGSEIYLNNNSQNLYLYVNDGGDVTATVYDNRNDKVEGAYIHVQKYDWATNTYQLDGVYKTNFEGQALLSLTQNTVYYRFLIYFPINSLVKSTSPTYIYSNSINFQVDLFGDVAEDFFNVQSIDYSLVYNNATANVRYIFSDPTSKITKSCLLLYKVRLTGNEQINSSCISSTGGTILIKVPQAYACKDTVPPTHDAGVCEVATTETQCVDVLECVWAASGTGGNTYMAKAFVYYNNNENFLDSIMIKLTGDELNSMMGLLIIIIMTIVFAFTMVWSIELGIILLPLPTLMGSIMGIVSIPVHFPIGIFIVALVIAIIISKSR